MCVIKMEEESNEKFTAELIYSLCEEHDSSLPLSNSLCLYVCVCV